MNGSTNISLMNAFKNKVKQEPTVKYIPKEKRETENMGGQLDQQQVDLDLLTKRNRDDHQKDGNLIAHTDKEEIDNIYKYYIKGQQVDKKSRAKTRSLKFEWGKEEDTLEAHTDSYRQNGKHVYTYDDGSEDEHNFEDKANVSGVSVWTKDYRSLTKNDFNLIRENYNIKLKHPNSSVLFDIARKWDDLAIYSKLRNVLLKVYPFQQPTPIQMQAIPLSLKFKDLLCVAPTGSGKTLAYLIPLLNFILTLPPIIPEKAYDGPYALVLAPSRELVIQIKEVFDKLAMPLGLRSLLVIGGHAAEDQISNFFSGCEVLFATIGRCQDLLMNHVISLNQCCYIIIDEADKMVELDLSDTFEYILNSAAPEYIKSKSEHVILQEEENMVKGDAIYRITQMYSATMPKALYNIANRYLHSPVTITIETEDKLKQNVSHQFEFINDFGDIYSKKVEILKQWLLKLPLPAILFANTKDKIEDLSKELKGLKLRIGVYHGGFEQKIREAVMEDFKNRKFDLLLSTDLGGRGLDIENLKCVINFDAPKKFESYVHRSGRTGRAGAKGTVFTILSRKNIDIFDELVSFLEERGLKAPNYLYQYAARAGKSNQRNKSTILTA